MVLLFVKTILRGFAMNTYETDSQLKNYKLPQGKKQIDLKDKKTENLYCRIRQSDKDTTKTTKTFLYSYRIGEAVKKITIGKYPSISLNEARLKAREYQIARDRGEVLQTQKEKALTFSEVANQWLDISQKAKSTLAKDISRLNTHIYPYIKDSNINELTRFDLIQVIEKIQAKAEIDGKGLNTSYKCFSILNGVMDLAVSKGYIQISPLYGVKFNKTFKALPEPTPRKAITDETRIKDFLKAVKNANFIFFHTKQALLFGIHTALRNANVRLLQWDYINFKKKLLTIPANEMKLKQEFILPLSLQVMAILDEVKKYNREFGINSPFVFITPKNSEKPLGENALNLAVKSLGFGYEMHFHGLRSTFSTICNEHTKEHGLNYEVIELCIDHKERKNVRAVYNRSERLNEKTELMQWYSDYLEKLEK